MSDNSLRTHRSIKAGTSQGSYPHIVLRYEKDGTVWYVDTNQDNVPYRACKDINKYKSVNFDTEYPIKNSTEAEIEKLIGFEKAFEELKKSDCSKILSHNFVFCKEVGEFFNALLRTEQNGIMFGPGGHGKSEMAAEIIDTAYLHQHTFIKSFGEGLNESSLYGGVNMRILRESGDVEFNLNKAFTSYEIIIFEELFDAPPSVLLSLKDTLTSGFVRNGTQREPIRCRCIIGLTNKSPQEIASNDSRQALTERFPLQINVKWSSYNSDDYEALIRKKFEKKLQLPLELGGLGLNAANTDFYITAFCEITEKSSKGNGGRPLSPRIATHGFNQIVASIRENAYDDRFYHFGILKFVTGYEKTSGEITERVHNIDQTIASKHNLSAVKSDYDKLQDKISKRDPSDHQRSAEFIKAIEEFSVKHAGKSFHDSHIKNYENMMRSVVVWKQTLVNEIANGHFSKLGLGKQQIMDPNDI